MRYLAQHPCHASIGICTSLPDPGDMDPGVPPDWAGYAVWYQEAVALMLRQLAPAQSLVLFQTDRKQGGVWHSKVVLATLAAESAGCRLLWHKVVCNRRPGATDLHRPGYSHLLAYSAKGKPGPATPDVILPSGRLYRNGMPVAAAQAAVAHLARTATTVLDPFCGYGTVLAAANVAGLGALGVDQDPAMVDRAKAATLEGVKHG